MDHPGFFENRMPAMTGKKAPAAQKGNAAKFKGL